MEVDPVVMIYSLNPRFSTTGKPRIHLWGSQFLLPLVGACWQRKVPYPGVESQAGKVLGLQGEGE